MEAIERLIHEHQQLLAVFDELEITDDALARTRLLGELAELLKTHATVEEEVFYPAIRTSGQQGAAAIVDEALAAHRAADLMLDEALGAEPTAANAKVLREMLEAHIDDEESRMFPLAESLGRAALARLASHLERREDELEDACDDEDPVLMR